MADTAAAEATEQPRPQAASFAYEAQTADGQTVAGTIDAPGVEQAQRLLQNLRLRVLRIEPAARPPRAKPLAGEDFLAFNQQLAHLTTAGLPIEHGLRLIAQDMRTRRLRATVQALAADLEGGMPLDQAFERHREKFPPLYARLIAAGVTTGNLPGMLLSLGRHIEMVYRLRAMLWRVLAYPLMVLLGLGLILLFISTSIVPQFEQIFRDFGIRLPLVTEALVSSSGWMPAVLMAIGAVVILVAVLWQFARLTGRQPAAVDAFVVPLPLVGPVIRRNLVARWCDALRLGVEAGLDLPRAIELAGDAVASPRLRRDGEEMIGAIRAGRPADAVVGSTRLLPATVPAAIALAAQSGGLPRTLATLTDMYQQQAETRLNLIPGLLTPVLIVVVSILIGLVILALFAPFTALLRAISGS